MGKATQDVRPRSSQLLPASKSKKRIRWTNELHDRFEKAVLDLGGPQYATPKGILERMNTEDVTIMHIKSHLQKYRLTITADNNTQPKGSDDMVNPDEIPCSSAQNGCEGAQTGDAHAEDELLDINESFGAAMGIGGGVIPDLGAPPYACTDGAARKKLVDTVVQQHTMQEELRHQIRVQSELYRNLQAQYSLLQQHFVSQTLQQHHARFAPTGQLPNGLPVELGRSEGSFCVPPSK